MKLGQLPKVVRPDLLTLERLYHLNLPVVKNRFIQSEPADKVTNDLIVYLLFYKIWLMQNHLNEGLLSLEVDVLIVKFTRLFEVTTYYT